MNLNESANAENNDAPTPASEEATATENTVENQAEEVAETPKQESRVKLNPTPAEMKAVGTVETPQVAVEPTQVVTESTEAKEEAASAEASSSATQDEAVAAMEQETTQAVNSEAIIEAMKESSAPKPEKVKVEIPGAEDLDDEIEAQLQQALAVETAAADLSANAVNPNSETPATLTEEEVSEGDRLKGKVQSVHGDDVFIDLGLRSSGVVSLRQFPKGAPDVGTEVNVKVGKVDTAEGLIHVNLSGGRQKVGGDWDAIDEGQLVDAVVSKTVKGGLEMNISNLRGFMPAGQVDINYVSDLETFVGQKMTVQVLEVNKKKRNLVVSRRACIQAEREEKQQEVWETLSLGQQHTGVVKTIKNYGAFIDIGMIDGFLHVGEISWMRIHHPSDVLKTGQEVDVQIISLDPEKKRIGLGMRQLVENPWTTAEVKYAKGTAVSGKVTRVADFGAFVELEPGVEGMIHISELDHKRVNRVADVLKEGQTVEAQVLEVDQKKHRIGLSLKALIEKPKSEPEVSAKEEEPPEPAYVRKRKGPLQGGMGNSSGGGLFGNPTDYK